jgi:hypothetical protein
MIGFIVAFIVAIFLAIYGWGTYFSLKKKRKSGVIRPLSHKKESTTIINEPNKHKSNSTDSRKP